MLGTVQPMLHQTRLISLAYAFLYTHVCPSRFSRYHHSKLTPTLLLAFSLRFEDFIDQYLHLLFCPCEAVSRAWCNLFNFTLRSVMVSTTAHPIREAEQPPHVSNAHFLCVYRSCCI